MGVDAPVDPLAPTAGSGGDAKAIIEPIEGHWIRPGRGSKSVEFVSPGGTWVEPVCSR